MSPVWHQAIIWTNDGLVLITGTLGTNFREICIKIRQFPCTKNAFESLVGKMAAISSRPQYIDSPLHKAKSMRMKSKIARFMGPTWQHGAHLGPVGPRWAPCWSHEPCYQGSSSMTLFTIDLGIGLLLDLIKHTFAIYIQICNVFSMGNSQLLLFTSISKLCF